MQVEDPSAYKRDTWAMSKEEKLAAVPVLHSEGNRLVLRREFAQAAAKYQEAVICLRNLQAHGVHPHTHRIMMVCLWKFSFLFQLEMVFLFASFFTPRVKKKKKSRF